MPACKPPTTSPQPIPAPSPSSSAAPGAKAAQGRLRHAGLGILFSFGKYTGNLESCRYKTAPKGRLPVDTSAFYWFGGWSGLGTPAILRSTGTDSIRAAISRNCSEVFAMTNSRGECFRAQLGLFPSTTTRSPGTRVSFIRCSRMVSSGPSGALESTTANAGRTAATSAEAS
jgi:hypothetical protein